jgi:transcriptional regulator with XRE-family HTH domain
MDQREFAAALCEQGVPISNSMISSMESGRTRPSIVVLAAIAKELDVSADYLLMLTEIPSRADAMEGNESLGLIQASEHAEEVIRLIDAMPHSHRILALKLVRAVAEHVAYLEQNQ